MSWTLALSAASAGAGAAKLGDAGSPEVVGFFPTVDRAVAFAGRGESEKHPEAVELIVPTSMSDYDLKWYLGELVITGIPAERVRVRTSLEVLGETRGEKILIADTSWKSILTAAGESEELAPERVKEIHAAQPAGTTLIVLGHPQERTETQKQLMGMDPVLLEHPQLALLALDDSGEGLELPGTSAVGTEEATPQRSTNVGLILLVFVIVIVFILMLSFLL